MTGLMARIALCLSILTLSSAGSTCLPDQGDGSKLCFTWSVASSNITFNVLCVPPTFPPPVIGPVVWCALGWAIFPNSNKMWPASAFVFGPLENGGCFVGDHQTAAYAQPACLPQQFSSVLGCVPGVGANSTNFTITRPLIVPSPAVSILPGIPYNILGAISTAGNFSAAPVCPSNSPFTEHASAFSGGPAITFL